jgi:aerobic-type carbon monoxide dehydrogenase small subunit (CoxS/CutS family)
VRINFMLNGTPESIDSDADVRLIDILRERFKLIGTHAGCYSGECGSCIVLINGEIFHACMTPLFRVRGMRVTTIEGFAKQSDYKEIMAGFKEAGLTPCRFCAAGRILITHALLDISPSPCEEEIAESFRTVKCRCTDYRTLVKAVQYAGRLRRNKHRVG